MNAHKVSGRRGQGRAGLLFVGIWAAALSSRGDYELSGSGGTAGQVYHEGPTVAGELSLSAGARGTYSFGVTDDFKIRPHLSIVGVQDNNLYLNSRHQTSDYYITVAPGVMLLYGDERRNYAYVDYEAQFSLFRNETDEDYVSHTLTALLHYETGKSQIDAWHRYRDIRNMDTILGARVSKTENTTSLGFDHRVSSKTSVGILGSHEIHKYDYDWFEDYRQYEVAGRVYWHMGDKTDLFGQVGHGWVDVDEDRRKFGDAEYNEFSIGVRGRLRPRLDATGRVGVQFRDFEDPRIEDFSHWVAGLRFDGRPYGHLKSWLGIWTSLRPAVNGPGFTLIETRVEPGLAHRLFTDRLVGSLAGVFGWAKYRGTADPSEDRSRLEPPVYNDRRDSFWGFTAAVDWLAGRYVSVGGGYSYIKNHTDYDANYPTAADMAAYDGGRWFLRAGFNF